MGSLSSLRLSIDLLLDCSFLDLFIDLLFLYSFVNNKGHS